MGKENLNFDDESEQIVSFLFIAVFSNEKENMLSVILFSYRNTHESLGELKKAVETLICHLALPQLFLFPQTSTCVSITQEKHGPHFLFLNQ